jgi:hypothetical protein
MGELFAMCCVVGVPQFKNDHDVTRKIIFGQIFFFLNLQQQCNMIWVTTVNEKDEQFSKFSLIPRQKQKKKKKKSSSFPSKSTKPSEWLR